MLSDHANVNLTEIVEQKTSTTQLRAIQEILLAVNDGLTISDACIIARIPMDTYERWCKEVPEIGQLIEIKRVEYKRNLIKALSIQAKDGDAKVAEKLLMTAFPHEYNPAIQKENEKNKQSAGNGDIYADLFNSIQDEATVPIDPNNGTVEQKTDGKGIKQMLTDLLV